MNATEKRVLKKPILTLEQEEALKLYESDKFGCVKAYLDGVLKLIDNPLSTLSIHELVHSLNGWYQVLNPLRHGDYVTHVNFGWTRKVHRFIGVNKVRVEGGTIVSRKSLRHATKKEIQQQKNKDIFANLQRNFGEFFNGDVVQISTTGFHLKIGSDLSVHESEILFSENKIVSLYPVQNRFNIAL